MKTLFLLLFGIALGAMGAWWVLTEGGKRETARTEKTKPGQAGTEIDLDRDTVMDEMRRSGEVVRRKMGEVGEAVADATTDARITMEIKAELLRHPTLSAWDIGVKTESGRVILSGEVDSPEQIVDAIALAMEVDGVNQVTSRIRVAEEGTEEKPETP